MVYSNRVPLCLCDEHHVVVKDVNHEKAKSLEKRVADLEQCLCICSSVVESKERSIDTLKRRYGNLFVDAVRMCRQFNGVLSVVAIGLDDPSPTPKEVKFFYDGLRPPKPHIEQIAILVTLFNRGMRLSCPGTRMVGFILLSLVSNLFLGNGLMD